MSEQKDFNSVRIYSIDLTTTDDCNFNCSYCFEHGHFNKNYFSKEDLFVKRVNELLESSFFKSGYDMLGIGFWGGEPTLNEPLIKSIVARYSKNNNVKFFIYSNGSNIEPYLEILQHYSRQTIHGHPKLCIQMSYDGMPVQDICRKTKNNKLTSNLVRNNILKLYSLEIPCVIKSTITLETFKYMPEARRDILALNNAAGNANFFKSGNYFPTIDYYHLDEYTPEEIEQYYKELKISLLEMAKEEIEYYKENNNFFFSWFTPNRALCCAGRDMVCLNWDGNVFKCHGAVYEDASGDHFLTNLEDDSFINKLSESKKLHGANFGIIPTQCAVCEAAFCLKCNAIKYNESKKGTYIEKWRDYTDQPRLCKFYKLNGKIILAINEMLKNNTGE
jgi:radical SAM protein with 4Fe4S-binding SPASM domain